MNQVYVLSDPGYPLVQNPRLFIAVHPWAKWLLCPLSQSDMVHHPVKSTTSYMVVQHQNSQRVETILHCDATGSSSLPAFPCNGSASLHFHNVKPVTSQLTAI